MALLVRVYLNAVFGALGGLLGWMLYGIFGKPLPSEQVVVLFLTEVDLYDLLAGALIGGMIGYFVVGVEGFRDRSLARFCRLATYGVVLGALGGAVGYWAGGKVSYQLVQSLNTPTEQNVGVLILVVLIRGLGVSLTGLAVGFSEGIASRSLGKLSYGSLGGALGGFVGGCLFGLYIEMFGGKSLDGQGANPMYSALVLIIVGACIGALSALVQEVFRPAMLKVLRGWQEGREYAIEKPNTWLGRDEHVDIALFRDMKVQKKHAQIQREGPNRFVLVNNESPPESTLVNDQPVATVRDLQDGDKIQLGNIVLRFHTRAARASGRYVQR
jgi:hypothetical protein